MKKHKIHQSDQEKLTSASQGTLSAVGKSIQKTGEVVKAVKDLQNSIDNKSDMIGGFTGVLKSLKKNNESINELKDYIDHPEHVIKKMEEVKSAVLITNQELKKLNKKEAPIVQKMELMGAEIVTIQGKKGDDGKTPKKGVDYYTPKEIASIKQEITPMKGIDYFDGNDGKTPKKGIDYFDGNDGKTPVAGIDFPIPKDGTPGIPGTPGKDGSPDTPNEVVDKINIATKKIDPKTVRGLLELFNSVDQIIRFPQGNYSTGGANQLKFRDSTGSIISAYITDLQFGTGITPVYTDGKITITASSGAAWGSITGTLSNQTDLQTALDKDKLIAEYHGTTTVTLTNANQLYNLQSVLIPANTFVTGDSVYIRSICGKNQSGATTRRMVLNVATTITTGGNQIAQFTSGSSGSRYILAVERITDIVATGLRTFEPTVSALTDISNAASATGTDVYPTVAIDWTVDQYINVCGLSSSAGTDMEIYHIEVWRYRI